VISSERQQELIDLLRREPGLAVPELAQRLDVSQGTVRNDLRALAQAGKLVRVRGGGSVLQDLPPFVGADFSARTRLNEIAKRAIGRNAAECVEDGASLLLDASTSAYHLGIALLARRGLRVVTNGIEVGRVLASNPTNMVLLIGGTLRAGPQSTTGPWSLRYLDEICAQFAFVSCSGFTPEAGMTEVDVYEAEFRQKAIGAATKVMALVDASKFGKIDLAPSVRPESISHIFTDCGLAPEWIERLNRGGFAYSLCE
jgi:DeoR/GlpR family transcriptional regulator of sugar metabolism